MALKCLLIGIVQVTDIKNNENKYYVMEMHKAVEKSKEYWRIFTHYGRMEDIQQVLFCAYVKFNS
jgi:hypothetical protein